MSETRRPTARTTRRAVALALAALVAVLLPVVAEAAPAAPSIQFVIGDSQAVPDTPGSEGLAYVVQGQDFTASLTFLDKKGVPTSLSTTDPTTVTLAYRIGAVTTGLPSAVLPAGASTTTSPALQIPAPASGVVIEATATAKNGQVFADSSRPFDVLIVSQRVNGPTSVGGDGAGVQGDCNPTANRPVCGDLIPPVDGFDTTVVGTLSQGCLTNTGCESSSSFVQALAAFKSAGAAPLPAPATLLMNCDKTLCGGGAINKKKLTVTLAPDPAAEFGGEVVAPACVSKGVVIYDPQQPYEPGNRPFCVDYVQSTRDIAGDTILYLLFVVDLKVRFP
jgi:hypothetical protein